MASEDAIAHDCGNSQLPAYARPTTANAGAATLDESGRYFSYVCVDVSSEDGLDPLDELSGLPDDEMESSGENEQLEPLPEGEYIWAMGGPQADKYNSSIPHCAHFFMVGGNLFRAFDTTLLQDLSECTHLYVYKNALHKCHHV